MNKERVLWLDNLKGLAILLVIFGYVFTDITEASFIDSLCLFFNMFSIPLFFFLSGIAMSYIKDNCSYSLPARTLNWFIIYLAYSVINIFYLFYIAAPAMKIKVPLPTDGLASILTEPPSQYWYIYFLIGAYIIHVILNLLPINEKVLNIIIVIISIGLLATVLFLTGKTYGYWILFFEMGYLIARCVKKVKYLSLYMLIVPILIALLIIFKPNEGLIKWGVLEDILVITCIIYILYKVFEIGLNRKIPVLTRIGRNTIWVYLLFDYAYFIAPYLLKVIPEVGIFGNDVVIGFMYFFITLGLPLLIGFLLKKTPIWWIFVRPLKKLIG